MKTFLGIQLALIILILVLLLGVATDWQPIAYMAATLIINILLLKYEATISRKLLIALAVTLAISVIVPVLVALFIGAYGLMHGR